jgi:hypothetical protein
MKVTSVTFVGSPKADGSYWTVTSIGYGRPTKVKKFVFYIEKISPEA